MVFCIWVLYIQTVTVKKIEKIRKLTDETRGCPLRERGCFLFFVVGYIFGQWTMQWMSPRTRKLQVQGSIGKSRTCSVTISCKNGISWLSAWNTSDFTCSIRTADRHRGLWRLSASSSLLAVEFPCKCIIRVCIFSFELITVGDLWLCHSNCSNHRSRFVMVTATGAESVPVSFMWFTVFFYDVSHVTFLS